jgi:hypothetical protein
MAFISYIKAMMTNHAVRPFLTFFITVLYNTLLAWAVMNDQLKISDYIVAVGPMNAMIIGFWFAEKAALKQPGSET